MTCASSKCSASGVSGVCPGAASDSYAGVKCYSSGKSASSMSAHIGLCRGFNSPPIRPLSPTANEAVSIRLFGGSRTSVGRVEVLYNGVWGTVCGLTLREAQAVCNLLGYTVISDIRITSLDARLDRFLHAQYSKPILLFFGYSVAPLE